MTELSKCQIPKKELFNFDFSIFFPSSGKASVLLHHLLSVGFEILWLIIIP